MMKNKGFYILFAALLLVLTVGLGLSGKSVSAQTLEDYYLEGNGNSLKRESAVNDYAGIYTQDQIAAFEEKMRMMREEYDCNVVAFVIDNNEWNSSERSAPERASEYFLNLDSHKSTVVLWLNICQNNRSLYILGYGSAEHKITDGEADRLAKDLQGYVKAAQSGAGDAQSQYTQMMDEFISQSDQEMRTPYFFLAWWFHLGLGLLVGTIVVLILVRNSGGKMTTNGKTYMNKSFSGLIGRRDIYTHTTYVRTRKSSSSGSRSGGGGRSHSSGGGRF
ncbi:MAG: hypothetical protein HFG37_02320 [Eubacterium sp.]|nr:hypothetical protein [Eubacterium sp.]